MRVGLLTSIPITISAFFADWIEYWTQLGHVVLTASGPPARPLFIDNRWHSTLASLSQRPRIHSWRAPMEIRRWQQSNKLDVVVANTATASFLSRMKKPPSPVIYFCHGLHWGDGTTGGKIAWEMLEKYALRNTAAVVTMNSSDRGWFDKAERPRFHLNLKYGVGLNTDSWPRMASSRPTDSLKLLWVGSFTKRKAPQVFVDLVRLLVSRGLAVEGVMLGEGPLQSRVRKSAVGLPISFPGQQKPLAFLESCHGVVLTSSWEGLTRVGLEACAVGRPLFGFDVKGVCDLPNAFVSETHKGSQGLADNISAWLKMPIVRLPALQDLDFRKPAQAVLDLAVNVSHES